MIRLASVALLVLPLALAQDAVEEEPAAVTVAQLPVLAQQLRAQQVEESELLALLETTLGAGVSLDNLVEALVVVVQELEAGTEVPNLAVRLPAMISQGHRGDELAQVVRDAGRTATASALAAPAPPVPVPPPPSEVEAPAIPSP